LSAYGNGWVGIGVTNGLLQNCVSNLNAFGMGAKQSVIINCTANNNSNAGIEAQDSSISNSTTNYNGGHGIRAAQSIVTNCIANNNSNGIVAHFHEFGTSSVQVSQCTANNNASHGFVANHNCRLEENNTRNNGQYGFMLTGNNNYAIKNSASGNGWANFFVNDPTTNYMPTSLTATDAANANIGW
jgi:parallel beta-helix repeat protein